MEATKEDAKCLRVLHVEDDKDLFTLAEGMIGPAGVEVTWAENLEAARAELAHGDYSPPRVRMSRAESNR